MQHIVAVFERYREVNGLIPDVRRIDVLMIGILRNKAHVRNFVGIDRDRDRPHMRIFKRQIACFVRRRQIERRRAVIGLGDVLGELGVVDLHRVDGHLETLDSGVLVIIIAHDLVKDCVRSRVGLCGNFGTEARGAFQTVLHLAVLGVDTARSDKLLRLTRIGQGFCCGRGDLVIGNGGLVDGQRLCAAGHRIAVLGGSEVNAIFSDRVTR